MLAREMICLGPFLSVPSHTAISKVCRVSTTSNTLNIVIRLLKQVQTITRPSHAYCHPLACIHHRFLPLEAQLHHPKQVLQDFLKLHNILILRARCRQSHILIGNNHTPIKNHQLLVLINMEDTRLMETCPIFKEVHHFKQFKEKGPMELQQIMAMEIQLAGFIIHHLIRDDKTGFIVGTATDGACGATVYVLPYRGFSAKIIFADKLQ
jgi:hypothetical protein